MGRRDYIIGVFFLCSLHFSRIESKEPYWKHPDTKHETVWNIPDSVATKAQLRLKSKIREFVHNPENMTLDGCKLMLTADSSMFKKKRIDVTYMKYIQESLDETNACVAKWIDEGVITEKELKQAFRKYMEEPEFSMQTFCVPSMD